MTQIEDIAKGIGQWMAETNPDPPSVAAVLVEIRPELREQVHAAALAVAEVIRATKKNSRN